MSYKFTEIAEMLSVECNIRKHNCIVIGNMYRREIAPVNLCGNNAQWCKSIKYLGVYVQSGKYVKFNISPSGCGSLR